MKKYLITYQDPKSASCDQETILCKGGLSAAKKYATANAQGWNVKTVQEIK